MSLIVSDSSIRQTVDSTISVIVSDNENHCIIVFDIGMAILLTNLERGDKEKGSSMNLVACLLTRQDI